LNIYKFHNKPEELNNYEEIYKLPEVAYKKAGAIDAGRVPELEPYIIKDPFYACNYAKIFY